MRVAVIDIGTNSTRLLVAEVTGGKLNRVLESGLVTTRLGEGISARRLFPDAISRTIDTLKDYLKIIHSLSVERVVAVATSAVRDALNREEFLAAARKIGLEVLVLSGTEEARFSYLGARSALNDDPRGMVLMDLGGGSTEFIWSEQEKIVCRSVNVGAVRMTEGRQDDEEILRLLVPVLSTVGRTSPRLLVGVGGTVTTMAAMAMNLTVYDPARVHGSILSLERVEDILNTLQNCTVEERRLLPGLQPERADIIIAGVRIARLVLLELGLPSLQVSEADIMYGLALQAAAPVERKIVKSYQ